MRRARDIPHACELFRILSGSVTSRVPVVDDEYLIRWSIAETLGAAGHEVAEAQDALSALNALAMRPNPDLVH